MNRSKSQELFRRAQEIIPGGVNSPVRAFRSVGGSPIFIARGQGSHIFDADGNEYIDYVGSWGPLLLGHRHPEILAALERALTIGTSFGAPTEQEIDLAEAIIDAVPSIEMVRLVNSGTEATMSAIRVARGFTGRDLIVKFEGCYHGHVDSLLVKAGSGMATLGIADTQGVPKAFCDTTIALPFNSQEAVEEAFRLHGDRIAAIIVEPVVGNMGCVPPQPGYLAFLREVTQRYGALLIIDEVMTGFRVAFGGAQQLYGVKPDLTTLGKVIGGGLPVGAYGGRKDIMSKVGAGRTGLPGGYLVGQSVGRGRRTGHVTPPQSSSRNLRPVGDAGGGVMRQPAGGSDGEPSRLHVHAVLHGRTGHRLGNCQAQRHGAIRALFRRDAGARCLPGAVSVRGCLCIGGAYRPGHPQNH